MARFRLPTPIETVFLAAATAMAWFAVVPTVAKARAAARVDLAARSLRNCDWSVAHLLRIRQATNRADVTLAQIRRDRQDAGYSLPVWPTGTDLDSFDPSDPAGCSIRVALPGGATVLVTAASNRVDHAN